MLHRHDLCLTYFSCNADKWTDVFGTEYRVKLIPPTLYTSDDVSWCGYVSTEATEMPCTLHSENIFPRKWNTTSISEYNHF
jgi:hypothetical protein